MGLRSTVATTGFYEVISYTRKRDKADTYEVLFDDCEVPVIVNAEEMVERLEDSPYLPA